MSIWLTIFLMARIGYGSPVSAPIVLAGNFGEPRPNHFHGGVDVKTGGVEGKGIFSIGDGYVWHISVGINGFGNAVYVRHPEGYTSVYCHLKDFSPVLRMRLRRKQYACSTSVGDFYFHPTEMPVSRGELIALSGNTGASQAPHLHLEILDTRRGDQLDPLDFIGNIVADGLPPIAHGAMAYPKSGEGVFNGSSVKQSFGFPTHQLSRTFTAWGKVGFGLWANDYMEATYNRYGVRRTELLVDDRCVFCSEVNRIAEDKTVEVNAWGDAEHFYRTGVWYLRAFTQNGTSLPFIRTDANAGYIDFNEERVYQLEFIITDFKGNTSRYAFTVTGKKNDIPERRDDCVLNVINWNRQTAILLPDAQLLVRKGAVSDCIKLTPSIRRNANALSDEYTFSLRPIRLFRSATIRLRVNQKVADPSKLYIVGKGVVDRYLGGNYECGWISAGIRDLHLAYSVDSDNEPPVISAVASSIWQENGVIKLRLEDAKSGVDRYEGSVDGQFVLFEEVEKSTWVECRLKDTPLHRAGKPRQLRFTAIDRCGNRRTFESQIIY